MSEQREAFQISARVTSSPPDSAPSSEDPSSTYAVPCPPWLTWNPESPDSPSERPERELRGREGGPLVQTPEPTQCSAQRSAPQSSIRPSARFLTKTRGGLGILYKRKKN